jgi:hypothetical protein
MKYRFTPFHLPIIYFLCKGFYILYSHSKLENSDSLELGGLAPYLFIGISLAILISDFIIQLAVGLTIKTNATKTIYIIESVIITIVLFWFWQTSYPTIIRQ